MPPAPPLDRASQKALLRRFEDAWRQGTPRLGDFVTEGVTRLLLIELVKIDLEYRWRRSGNIAAVPPGPVPERPRLEDYVRHFPLLGKAQELPAELIGAEYSVRHWVGDRPTHDEMLRRFPAQAGKVRLELLEVDAEIARERPSEESGDVPVPLPTRAPVSTAAEWWRTLRDLPILPSEQFAALAAEGLPGRDLDPEALARLLVEERYLTAFQANLLLAGRGQALLVGPYVILEPIGEGLTSRVFRARHRLLNRTLALKVFRAELVRDVSPEVLERFTREMRAIAPLSHENVIHAYDAGLAGANYYIAMQLVAGCDLQRRVRESGPLDIAAAADCIRQVALGLAHIRQHGLVHRDLKPSNLMLTPPTPGDASHAWGLVQILDLGMARLHWSEKTRSLGTLTRHGQVMGTADYMAPEQALDPHRIDIRADLYSLGCTFYFLVTGRPPFPGGTLSQKLNRHMAEEPVPPESLRAGLPADLSPIIARLMAKRPEDRFQTPEEVAALLTRCLPAWSKGALPNVPASAARARRVSLPMLLAAFGAAALLLVCLLGVVVHHAFRTSPASTLPETTAPVVEKRKRFALEFDRDTLVTLPDDLVHHSKGVTVEMWFRTSTGGALFGYQHTVYPERPSLNVPLLYVGQDGLLRGAVWRGAVDPIAGSMRVNDDRWHHAALTSDGRSQSLYQDGKLVGTYAGTTDHLTMTHNQIGMAFLSNWPGGNGNWMGFVGQIRDVRVWHSSRTAKQIADGINGTLAAKEPGLAAYYPCDETGDVLFDRSGHQRNGKLGGGNKAARPRWLPLP